MTSSIPDKYLNTNVQAMLIGGVLKEESPVQEKNYVLQLNKLFSILRKSYRLEVTITKEDSQGEIK